MATPYTDKSKGPISSKRQSRLLLARILRVSGLVSTGILLLRPSLRLRVELRWCGSTIAEVQE